MISILSENVVISQILQLSHIRSVCVHSTTHGISHSTIGESINSICCMKPYFKGEILHTDPSTTDTGALGS